MQHYFWRVVDYEGEVQRCHVSKKRNIRGVGKSFLKSVKKHAYPKIITIERLASYGAVFKAIGIERMEKTGRRLKELLRECIRIFRSGNGRGQCNASGAWQVYKNLDMVKDKIVKDKHATISIWNGILFAGKHKSENERSRSMGGAI